MVQAGLVDEGPVPRRLPQGADPADHIAGPPLCDGGVGHLGVLGARCPGDELHGQARQGGHAADGELARRLQADHEGLESLRGVDPQLLHGLLAERPGGGVVLVLVDGEGRAGRRQFFDGAGGPAALPFAMFASHGAQSTAS